MKNIVNLVYLTFILGLFFMGNLDFIYAQNDNIDTSDYGIIRIKDPNNPGKGITIHDRNLGATATGAGIDESRQSFGYYFQWGNNYGFSSDPNANIITDDIQVDASEYGPNTTNGYYSSNTFIIGNGDWSSMRNDNLRGGSGDSRDSNGRGYPVTNPKDRRGPCPENYHVPSIGEWNKLLEFWVGEFTGVSLEVESNGLYKFKNNISAFNSFSQRFNLSLAGQLDSISAIISYPNIRSLFWSSSPSGLSEAFRLYGYPNNIFAQYINSRTYAFPIRCFYDSYRLPVIVTYDANGGYWVDEEDKFLQKIITYTKKDDSSEYLGNISLGIVKRNDTCGAEGNKKCTFAGWYTLTGDEMWTGNISEDITLYAKWFTYDDRDISYSGVNFTIMDRNLGAEIPGTEESAYGYYLTGGEEYIVCPEGYHIPSTGEWLGIRGLFGSDFNGDLIKDLLNLPFPGKIINNEVIETEGNGYYLAKDGDGIKYAKINNSDIVIGNLNEGEKVSARCFKNYNTGTVKFYTNGGNSIDDIIAENWWEEGEDLEVPERDNSIFLGRYTTSNFQEGTKTEKNINYKNEGEINLYARWECKQGYQENGNKCEKIPNKPGGSSGGCGGGNKKNAVIQSGTKGSEESNTGSNLPTDSSDEASKGQISPTPALSREDDIYSFPLNKKDTALAMGIGIEGVPQEFIDAYNFAFQNGITTKKSIYDAKMYSSLTRIQMAKMLSNYAINVLGKQPDLSKGMIKFKDVSNKLNKEYDNAVTLAYQLGIMGQNIKNNKFKPYDEVTRAEFATALSRLLYSTHDGKGKNKYYEPHITKLYNEGIINKTNPTIKEKRGYIMIMLMRSVM